MHKTLEQILEILILNLLPPLVALVSFGGQTRFTLNGSIFPQFSTAQPLVVKQVIGSKKLGNAKKWY